MFIIFWASSSTRFYWNLCFIFICWRFTRTFLYHAWWCVIWDFCLAQIKVVDGTIQNAWAHFWLWFVSTFEWIQMFFNYFRIFFCLGLIFDLYIFFGWWMFFLSSRFWSSILNIEYFWINLCMHGFFNKIVSLWNILMLFFEKWSFEKFI